MLDEENPYKITIVAPTCLYYQVKLFQTLAADPKIELTVCFCSQEALESKDIPTLYMTDQSWGPTNDLLTGYRHKFLRNFSPRPSYLSWPFGLMNLGIWNEIKRNRPDLVILMGWNNLTWWIAVLASRIFNVPFLYMNDANVQAEISQPIWKKIIKKIMLGSIFFNLASGFLSSGRANDVLYESYGVKPEKVIPFAYSLVHYDFIEEGNATKHQREEIRADYGIPKDSFVLLYCGRFIRQKGIFELMEAYQKLDIPNKRLIFVGNGEELDNMKKYVRKHDLKCVDFPGFQPRHEISKYYKISDILVLPSWRETWGMVINEALCFSLPVVVSDQVGARQDLVIDGYNGFSFPVGDVDKLAEAIESYDRLPSEKKNEMGQRSFEIINEWSSKDIISSLLSYMKHLNSK